ncbi:Uncharacterised protein [Mycoplasmopsis citelli]|uniref:Uncharacterized protein n=1 Tax=Mycoplasmopsis citelli TaxID=171281 RepID=A0A449B113_9BACT|nr:hypothetical protein [Mycoplasmopsis citelli]VEU74290.1 Uncharacterised protein [Mycoplasmopsis citelli]
MLRLNDQGLNNLKSLEKQGFNIDEFIKNMDEIEKEKNNKKYWQKMNKFINMEFDNEKILLTSFEILNYDSSYSELKFLHKVNTGNFEKSNDKDLDKYIRKNKIMKGSVFKKIVDLDYKTQGSETKYKNIREEILKCNDNEYYKVNKDLTKFSKEKFTQYKQDWLNQEWYQLHMDFYEPTEEEIKHHKAKNPVPGI